MEAVKNESVCTQDQRSGLISTVENHVLPWEMGREVNPAPHQHLGSMGQKGHPQCTSGHKHGTTFASRGQRNVNGNDPACCDCSVCPVFLPSSLGEGGKEKKSEVIHEGGKLCLPE